VPGIISSPQHGSRRRSPGRTVTPQFARCLFREDLITAYLDDELVGFAMVGNARRCRELGQIISRLAYRHYGINNALIAAAVAVCECQKLPYFAYYGWGYGALVDFKGHDRFAEVRLPRCHVPLTARGRIALRFGVHRGWKEEVLSPTRDRLRRLRSRQSRIERAEET
jgi:hypothetical protein